MVQKRKNPWRATNLLRLYFGLWRLSLRLELLARDYDRDLSSIFVFMVSWANSRHAGIVVYYNPALSRSGLRFVVPELYWNRKTYRWLPKYEGGRAWSASA